jgi:hypothetical protein
METKEKYFNFPIQLLDGFMINDKKVLNNIFDYAIYVHSTKLEFGTDIQKMKASAEYYNATNGNITNSIKNAKLLLDSIPENSPMVGIGLTMFWEFYKNEKTEFEKICLLGYLALKSILLLKPCCKLSNKYWLSRMDGKAKSISDYQQLSEPIRKYANEYQTKKIKDDLVLNWGLVTYSRYTRGFYVSYQLELKALIIVAEKTKKAYKMKELKFKEKQILSEVLMEINPPP